MKKSARKKSTDRSFQGPVDNIKGLTWVIFVPEAEAKVFEEIMAGDFSDMVIQ